MFGSTGLIVGFWFLPVILFIILPLAMLCGWLIVKAFAPLMLSRRAMDRSIETDEEAIPLKGS